MNIAIILCGGIGSRMNTGGVPKQFLKLNDKEIIIHTIEKFEKSELIDKIVAVCINEQIEYLKKLVNDYNLKKVDIITSGGNSRNESIYKGLLSIKDIVNYHDIVISHDGVRPLIDIDIIDECIKICKLYGSAIAIDDFKELTVEIKDNMITNVGKRENTKVVKTPHAFYFGDLYMYHKKSIDENRSFIDCVSMMNYYGKKLYIVNSNKENIKITTREDLYLVDYFLNKQGEYNE